MTTDEIRARTADILARAAAERTRATAEDAWPLPDPVAQWKADADERTAEREAAKVEIASVPRRPAFDWGEVDTRIQQAIESERRLMAEALGEEVGKLLNEERRDTMRKVREELRELRIECAKLGSESAALREALAVERGKPVDLPALPRRNIN